MLRAFVSFFYHSLSGVPTDFPNLSIAMMQELNQLQVRPVSKCAQQSASCKIPYLFQLARHLQAKSFYTRVDEVMHEFAGGNAFRETKFGKDSSRGGGGPWRSCMKEVKGVRKTT